MQARVVLKVAVLGSLKRLKNETSWWAWDSGLGAAAVEGYGTTQHTLADSRVSQEGGCQSGAKAVGQHEVAFHKTLASTVLVDAMMMDLEEDIEAKEAVARLTMIERWKWGSLMKGLVFSRVQDAFGPDTESEDISARTIQTGSGCFQTDRAGETKRTA